MSLNGTDVVTKHIANSSDVDVSFNKEWFIIFNMAMIAFSATLIVHVNCWVNSLWLLRKDSLRWMRRWNFVQASCAVSCHISRITDYFFSTDCMVKGFYNLISYYVAMLSMDLMAVIMAYFTLRWLFNCSYRVGIIATCIMGGLPYIAKCAVILGATLTIQNAVVDFNYCAATFSFISMFPIMMFTEVGCHMFTFFYYSFVLYKAVQKSYTKDSLASKIFNNEFTYLILMDIGTVALLTPVGVNNAGPNPEVFAQVRWAFVSKCFNVALIQFIETYDTDYSKVQSTTTVNEIKQVSTVPTFG